MRIETATITKNGQIERYNFYIFSEQEINSYKSNKGEEMQRPDFNAMRAQAFNEVMNSLPDTAPMSVLKELVLLKNQYVDRLEFEWNTAR